MPVYETEYRISYADADQRKRLRISRLFTLLQEISMTHAAALGLGSDKTLDSGLLWIVTLQQATVHRTPVYGETVRLSTWPGKLRHFLFPRYYRVSDAQGNTLVEASALWALMDSETRKIVFPEQRGLKAAEADVETAIPLPVSPETPDANETEPFTVPLSFVDLNGHMNNTRCFDLAEDRMPKSFRTREIRLIRSEYARETLLDTTLSLKSEARGDAFLLSGESDGKKFFKVSLTFAHET